MTKSRREDLPFGEMWFERFTDCVSPMESPKFFVEVPWLVREVPSQVTLTIEITTYKEERVGMSG